MLEKASMGKLSNAIKLLRRGRIDLLVTETCMALHLPAPAPRFPSSLMMEPTNACNLKCPTCPTGTGKLNRPKRMMTMDEFKGIIDQAKGRVESLVLWNYGEPFLHKDILDMVAYAEAASIETVVSTNGHFFPSVDYCRKVVSSGLHKLIVCVDGLDQETVVHLRTNASLEKITTGLKYMVQARKEMASKTPEIQLQFILMKHNEHQKESARRMALELGVDIFCVKPVGLDTNDPDFQRLAQELLPNDLSDSHFERDAAGHVTVKGKAPDQCWWLSNVAVINSDGTVVPCCYDLYSSHIMGNAFQQPLAEIWRGPAYRQFRRGLRKDRKSIPICRECFEGRTLTRHEEKLGKAE
jgi:radical SAM protein with 4Fe4S-binding SPASM domain